MAENKGILLAKSVQKHAGRAKEKLLQNLGKVDRTADEIFDEHLTNFTRQQNSANRLQKEFNNYIRCVRAVQTASKTLMDAISEVYESQWTGSEALYAQAAAVEVLWQDFSHKLGDQVLIPLNTYTAQFPEMRKKIDKRGRKLVDYDSQRHSFQSLQANAAKRKDDVKVTKGREQLEEAKRTYEVLNTELHDELPALHDSRILFLVTNLQTLFASEQMFHNETSKVYAELEAIVDKLATESQRGSYTLKKITANNSTPSSPPQSPVKATLSIVNSTPNYPPVITNGSANGNANGPLSTSPSISPTQQLEDDEPSYQNTAAILTTTTITTTSTSSSKNLTDKDKIVNDITPLTLPSNTNVNIITTETNNHLKIDDDDDDNARNESENLSNRTSSVINNNLNNINNNNNNNNSSSNNNNKQNNNNNNKMEELYDIPVGATTANLPPGVLYRVKATYKYVREDVDELSFEVGDLINVVEYEDPEDQVGGLEEGWLMGCKDGSDEKGMFPANFTRPV